LHIITQRRDILTKHPVLLITGDGKTLPDDLEQFLDWNIAHDVMSIGRSHKQYPLPIEHYADVDADAGKWVVENLVKNNPKVGDPIKHTLGDVAWFDVCWEMEQDLVPSDEILWHGSTALFGVLIGLEMGYEQIILAGCPMDSKGHWYYPEEKYGPKWTFESYQSWFEFAEHPESKKVCSLSGYTKTLLGGWPL
jgi:hypothetical protein